MEIFEFVLKFQLPDCNADPEQFLDVLYEHGCDDALVGLGRKGMIALDFSREAVSAEQAVMSAVKAIMAAIPGARLIEAGPDLINLSDLAELMGCSRQNALLGASPGRINMLHVFSEPVIDANSTPAAGTDFSNTLAKLLKQKSS